MKKIVSAITAPFLLAAFVPGVFAADIALAGTGSTDPAIAYVRSEKIMQDLQDGKFHAEQPMSKSDFIVMMIDRFYAHDSLDSCYMNIAPELPPHFTLLFSDVPTSAWYAKHVCMGMFTGLLNGNADGSFKPLKGITNAEASVVMARAYGLVYPTLKPVTLKWYETPMWVLRQQGALPSKVDPAAMMTRGQVAKMLYALRNQQRFPAESRYTHAVPAQRTTTAPAAVLSETETDTVTSETNAVPEPTMTSSESDTSRFFRTPAPQVTYEPVEWIDADTAARSRRAPKVTRRQLLMDTQEQAQ